MNQTIGRRLRGPALSLLCFFCVIFLSAACATGHHLLVRADMAEAPAVAPIAWMSPAAEGDRAILSRWRSAVGPPVARLRASANLTSADEITVVSWNIALGAGDVERFAAALPLGNAPVVLLLQEVYRGGPDVPRGLARDASFAARLGGSAAGPDFDEVERTADKLGLSLYYVPSIRRASPTGTARSKACCGWTTSSIGCRRDGRRSSGGQKSASDPITVR